MVIKVHLRLSLVYLDLLQLCMEFNWAQYETIPIPTSSENFVNLSMMMLIYIIFILALVNKLYYNIQQVQKLLKITILFHWVILQTNPVVLSCLLSMVCGRKKANLAKLIKLCAVIQ